MTNDLDQGSYQLSYIARQIRENGANKKFISNLFLLVSNNLDKEVETTVSWSVLSWINAENKLIVDGISGRGWFLMDWEVPNDLGETPKIQKLTPRN